jgi:hypothetical protein
MRMAVQFMISGHLRGIHSPMCMMTDGQFQVFQRFSGSKIGSKNRSILLEKSEMLCESVACMHVRMLATLYVCILTYILNAL